MKLASNEQPSQDKLKMDHWHESKIKNEQNVQKLNIVE